MDNVTFIRLVSGLLAIVIAVPTYFAPSLVARRRKKRNAVAIFVLNLVAGWTIIGWVAALIWSFMSDSASQITGQQTPPPILCSACGNYSLPDALFCKNCGQPLASLQLTGQS